MNLRTHFLRSLASLVIAGLMVPGFSQAEPALPLFKKVEHTTLTFIPWQDEEWPQESFYDYLHRCMDYQRKPQEFKKRRLAFKVLYGIQDQQPDEATQVLHDATTWQDLCLFSGTYKASACLVDTISRTKTQVGKATLACMLSNPSTDIGELKKRQAIIKELVENPRLYDELTRLMNSISESELLTLSFWSYDPLEQPAQRRYLNIPGVTKVNNILNKNDVALEVSNLWDHQLRIIHAGTSAAAAVILPVYAIQCLSGKKPSNTLRHWAHDLFRGGTLIAALKYGFSFVKHKGDLREAADHGAKLGDGILYAFSVKGNCEWVRDNIVLDMCLQEKLIAVANYIKAVRGLAELMQESAALEKSLSSISALYEILYDLPQDNGDVAHLFELLETGTFKNSPSILSRKGRVFVAYKLMHEVKKDLIRLLGFVGELDAYLSIAQLYKELESSNARYCFVDFVSQQSPLIEMHDFWNPFVDSKKVVTNSLTLDAQAGRANVILTGPNAGGKSTILKATALSLILAQSFGIAPARSMKLTPFNSIATYLNITDDIASGNSLFKAEVLRAQTLVEKIQKLKEHEFSFVAIDEMFSGTSPEEGRAAAYSVAKHLGSCKNSICMIATHYPLLTHLEKDTPYFANYKVSVSVSPQGVITYPFKLESGVSNQHVAIDILQAEGFNNQILADARKLIPKHS